MGFFFLWLKLESPSSLTHPPPSPLLNHGAFRTIRFWSSSSCLRNKILGLLAIETEISIKLNIVSWPQSCFSSRPKKAEQSYRTNPCKVGQNNSMADIRNRYNDQLSPSSSQSIETTTLNVLVTVKNDFSLCNLSFGTTGEQVFEHELSVTPGMASCP